MQIRYDLPDDEEEVRPAPAKDWHFLSWNRIFCVLFLCLNGISLLAGAAGFNFRDSFTLGLGFCVIIAGVIFYPGSPL